jgi:hypothetical protein
MLAVAGSTPRLLTDNPWEQLALSKMHADQQELYRFECKSKPAKPRASNPKNPKQYRGIRPKLPSSEVKSRGSYSKPIRQSLCATHPAQYAMAPPPAQKFNLKPPMSSAHLTQPQALPHDNIPHPSPLYQVYSDPKRLAGFGEPALSDPSPRMLKIDTHTSQANIVSPMFLVSMPFGSLVESAAFYSP